MLRTTTLLLMLPILLAVLVAVTAAEVNQSTGIAQATRSRPDVLIDADGAASTGVGSPEALSIGDPLVPLTDSNATFQGSPGVVCTDSISGPSVVWISLDGNCDVADGSHAEILGTVPSDGAGPEGTLVEADAGWSFHDVGGDGSYGVFVLSGDDLYLDRYPTGQYQ